MKGIVGYDKILADDIPQIAFIGRSNVGKSSLINLLTNSKIARTSSFPGRTQEINIFLINDSFYLVDIPGYGFARLSSGGREKIGGMIDNYLFNTSHNQKKIILIIDANIGFTETDLSMLDELKKNNKNFLIIANKIDKMNQSESYKKLKEIEEQSEGQLVIPFSTKKKKGLETLLKKIFS